MPVSDLQARHMRSIEKFTKSDPEHETEDPATGEKMQSTKGDRSAKEIRMEEERLALNVHKELKELELGIERQRRMELQRRQSEMPILGCGEDEDENEDVVEKEAPKVEGITRRKEGQEGPAKAHDPLEVTEDGVYIHENGVKVDPAAFRPVYQRANNALFDYLDEFHENIDSLQDEVFQYRSNDLLVVEKVEVPVVVNVPSSQVTFEFRTQEGDIGFGVVFATYTDVDDSVEDGVGGKKGPEMNFRHLYRERVVECAEQADEPMRGSFLVQEPGVLFFLFNNEHDWTANKRISYVVDVQSPSFSQPDEERSAIAVPMLDDCCSDLLSAKERHDECMTFIQESTRSIAELERAIAHLKEDLGQLSKERQDAVLSKSEHERKKTHNRKLIPGLGIRCLAKREMYHLLTYVPTEAACVCQYWRDLARNHGLNYNDRVDLLTGNSPRRRKVEARNKETAALPLPGKKLAPRRRYPGFVNKLGSASSHGVGGDFGKDMPEEDEDEDEDEDENEKEEGKEEEDPYWPSSFRKQFSGSTGMVASVDRTRPARAHVPPPRLPSPSNRASGGGIGGMDLSPRGYQQEDYASLYEASSFMEGYGSSSGVKKKAQLPTSTPPHAPNTDTDTISISNAKAKGVAPASRSYPHHAKGTPVRGARMVEEEDSDSLDDVITGVSTRLGMKQRGGRLDAAAIIKEIDEAFTQDEEYEVARAALKRKLQVWVRVFSERKGRPPTNAEKRRNTQGLFGEYQAVRAQQDRNLERISHLLGTIDMTLTEYRQLTRVG